MSVHHKHAAIHAELCWQYAGRVGLKYASEDVPQGKQFKFYGKLVKKFAGQHVRFQNELNSKSNSFGGSRKRRGVNRRKH